MSTEAKPFLKWAGGKGQLLSQLSEYLPTQISNDPFTYIEPFVGGGAMLFYMLQNFSNIKKAVINDVNDDLILTYRIIKDDVETLITNLDRLEKNYLAITEQEGRSQVFYEVRERYNKHIGDNIERASQLIFLNKTCFNGLYRVNSKGLFNVPYNNSTTVKTISEENLINIGRYLTENDVKIRLGDFEAACFDCSKGDFVYLDSPYIPVSKTAYFTDYTKDGFTYDDHKRLSKLFRALDKKGIKVMLSNNDVPLAYELYDGFNIENVDVRRNINSNANKRTGKEVIITNY